MPRLLVTLAALCAPALLGAAEPIPVLIIDGQNNHDWRATTPHLKKVLEDGGHFAVEVATAPPRPQLSRNPTEADRQKFAEAMPVYKRQMEAFRPPIERFRAVLLNYNGDPWPPAFQRALEEYVRTNKGGLVIVHAANNSFPGWAEYDKMIGLGWRDNKYGERLVLGRDGQEKRVAKGAGPGAGHGPQHAFAVTTRDKDHPITRGLPAEWMHARDELYHGLRGPIADMHLLATAFSDKAKGGTGEHEPMIWTLKYGEGRVFHTPMGHDLTGMCCLGFVTVLRRGTEWAATGAVTIPVPADFPTDQVRSLPGK
jgi:uncharacterized protein